MPSNGALLSIIFIPILACVAARPYGLITNYLQARQLGIPIVLIPFSWQDDLWNIIHPHLRRFRNVPGLRDIITFSYHSWAQDERYRPHRRLGDVFAIVSPGKNEIVVNDPIVAIEVQSHYKSWLKPGPLYEIFNNFGPNVITLNGEDWQRHRRIVNPAFREQNNKLVWEESSRQARQMIQVFTKRADGARKTMLDIRNDCVLIAMHVLSAAGFGHVHDFDGGFRDIPEGHSASLAEALKFLLQNILFGILFKNVPLLRWTFPALYSQMQTMSAEF